MSTLTISETLVAVITGVTCLNHVAVMSAAFWRRRRLSEEETYEYVLQEYPCFPDSVFARLHTLLAVSRDSIVRIATSYGLDGPGFEFRREKTRLDLVRGPPSLLFNGYRGSLSGVKWPGREVDYSPTSSSEAKNEWDYTSAPSLCFMTFARTALSLYSIRFYILRNRGFKVLLLKINVLWDIMPCIFVYRLFQEE